ncbi:hypothetical protein HRbin36_02299 [bacterium HR36]|uniref:Secreted glycosyl hydrolase n=1 Tax=uncultured Planctomycetota bacterium TaxID=120965 RepID=H5SCT6_9BACT|nr:secreted glycosyl hydrolase [uncultured Planctomycetota bacterium]GBD37169.1 hypothetical protein HRbin36_02299 [bacterium HR36]
MRCRALIATSWCLCAIFGLWGLDPNVAKRLSRQEIQAGWLLLFDGESTFGWKTEGDVAVNGGRLIIGGNKASRITCTTAWSDGELSAQYQLIGTSGHVHVGNVGIPLSAPDTALDGVYTLQVTIAGGKPTAWQVTDPKMQQRTGSLSPSEPPTTAPISISVADNHQVVLHSLKFRPTNLKPIFNGKDLEGWKEVPGKKSKFTVTEKGELNITNGPGDIQTVGEWDDFVLQLEIFSHGKHLNSGVFFRCLPGEFWSGYEAQVRNEWQGEDRSKPVDFGTGGLYNRQPARRVVSDDNEWFTMTVVAQGPHIAIWVNGFQTVDYTDTRPPAKSARQGTKLTAGPISLQGHDPTTNLSFRNIRLAQLPKPKP